MRASVVMCIDLQKTTTVTTFPKARIGDIEFKVDAGCNIGDSLPPTAMLSRGRRYMRVPEPIYFPEAQVYTSECTLMS